MVCQLRPLTARVKILACYSCVEAKVKCPLGADREEGDGPAPNRDAMERIATAFERIAAAKEEKNRIEARRLDIDERRVKAETDRAGAEVAKARAMAHWTEDSYVIVQCLRDVVKAHYGSAAATALSEKKDEVATEEQPGPSSTKELEKDTTPSPESKNAGWPEESESDDEVELRPAPSIKGQLATMQVHYPPEYDPEQDPRFRAATEDEKSSPDSPEAGNKGSDEVEGAGEAEMDTAE